MACTKKRARKQQPAPMTMTAAIKIMDEVSRAFGVSKSDMIGVSRLRVISYARFEAWHRMRTEIKIAGAPISLPRVAAWFGRDHTTVLAGLRSYLTDEVQKKIYEIKAICANHEINAGQAVNRHVQLWPNRSYYGRIEHGTAALPTPSVPLVANT